MHSMRVIVLALLGLGLALVHGELQAQACLAGNPNANLAVSQPSSDYVAYSDGTVRSTKTGLMWKRCAEGQTWNAGTSLCDNAPQASTWSGTLANSPTNFAYDNDWRLPNVKELQSIAETCGHSPALNTTLFPNAGNGLYWTSSSESLSPGYAWAVDAQTGLATTKSKNSTYNTRLVRGPITSSFDFLIDDVTPDSFSIPGKTNQPLATLVASDPITLSGIGHPTSTISVSNGEYSVNGGAYTANRGAVSNGNTVTVRLTSSGSYNVMTSATLTVGTVSAPFFVSTMLDPNGVPPTAPLNVVAKAASRRIRLSFSPPSYWGQLPGGGVPTITQYTATCGAQSNIGSSSPIVVSGLSNGMPYTCGVTATNSVPLTGPAGTAAPVTPRARSASSLLLLD